jgi:Zn-finger nucleic acid-binding protein
VNLRIYIYIINQLSIYKSNFCRGVTTSQYELNEIITKIKNKSPFEIKNHERGRIWSLRVIASKLYYSLDYEKEPQATRQKVTQLLLYHGQFSREEIDKMFESSAKETTDYSIEFLKLHPDVAKNEALKSKEFPDETEREEGEKLKETIYRFPHYS